MRYQLVVQIKPAQPDDFDRLVNWENALIEHLAMSAEADGHDLGAGEFNVFIFTDDPSGTFRKIQSLPETQCCPHRWRRLTGPWMAKTTVSFGHVVQPSSRSRDGQEVAFQRLYQAAGSRA